MTREHAKELAPIIAAYAEGKMIEVSRNGGLWTRVEDPCWSTTQHYRIKPEPRMRPMTRGEVLYKVTTTPGMVVKCDGMSGEPLPANLFNYALPVEAYKWAIIDASGNTGEWHKFEVDE